MFNPDFYPTPDTIIAQMVAGVNLEGRIILEPSAGKGNIVDYLQLYGANVLACEKDPNLASIVANKCRLLKDDFLEVTPEEVTHIDCIVMNPPFSADEKHILHAWTIAPEGCEIIALCNYETIRNHYSSSREKLYKIVDQFGNSQNLGEVFSTAERKTNVSIGLIRLFKPRVSAETEFDGYFDMIEEYEQQYEGLMPFNDVRNIVNRYVGAVKMFNEVIDASSKMNSLISPISGSLDISFGAYRTRGSNYAAIDRDTFKKELQKSAWQSVFSKMNMRKYVTKSVIGELNSFVEKQSNVPFTIGNVYKMIEMIIGTHKERMERVLVEAFEKICGYSDQNSTAKERWKTNSDYKINRRFIHPYICKYDTRWPSSKVDINYSSGETLDDVVKALCAITGKNFDEQIPLYNFFSSSGKYKLTRNGEYLKGYENHFSKPDEAIRKKAEYAAKGIFVEIELTDGEWGQWYDWGFFRIRGYKKGTMHFEFRDEKVWELFNRRVAEIKGWALPRKTNSKHKGTEHVKETGLVLF